MAYPAASLTAKNAPGSCGELAADHALLCRFVREAGAIALDYFHRRVKGWDKRPNDPVSEADLAVDSFLRRELTQARPAYGWLSEESDSAAGTTAASRSFVVDPIDGTRSFLRGRPEFAVAAAVTQGGVPLAAAVFNPATDEFFEAITGGGARCNGLPISVLRKSDLSGAKLLVSWREFQRLCEDGKFVSCEMSTIGSIAYKIALVAAGKADAVVALAPKSDWDLAAAHLILEEAGGRITDAKGAALAYHGAGHPSIVAADPGLHAQLLARLSRH
jgi:myo-inositol-1(or 4)-monophosphatase